MSRRKDWQSDGGASDEITRAAESRKRQALRSMEKKKMTMSYVDSSFGKFRAGLGKYAKGWHVLDPFRPWELPAIPACYVFFIDGRAVYVGQTVNLKVRIRQHNPRHGYGGGLHLPWAQVPPRSVVVMKAKFCGAFGSWAMREMRLIYRLKPCFNKAMQRGKAA